MALPTDALQIDRDDLAGFLPNLRAIKAFERLQTSVAETIPTQVNQNTQAIGDITTEVAVVNAQSRSAQSAADRVAQVLEQVTALLMTQRDDRTVLMQMQRQIDELRAIVLGS